MATFVTTNCDLSLPLIHQMIMSCMREGYILPYAQVMLDSTRTEETDRTLIICDARITDHLSKNLDLTPYLPRRGYEQEVTNEVSLELVLPKFLSLAFVQTHMMNIMSYFRAYFAPLEITSQYPSSSRRLDTHNGVCALTIKASIDEDQLNKDETVDLVKAFFDHQIWPGCLATTPLDEVYFKTRWVYPSKERDSRASSKPISILARAVAPGDVSKRQVVPVPKEAPPAEPVKSAKPVPAASLHEGVPDSDIASRRQDLPKPASKTKSSWAQMVIQGAVKEEEEESDGAGPGRVPGWRPPFGAGGDPAGQDDNDEKLYSLPSVHPVALIDA